MGSTKEVMRQKESEEKQDVSTEQRREQSTFPELQGWGEDASEENTRPDLRLQKTRIANPSLLKGTKNLLGLGCDLEDALSAEWEGAVEHQPWVAAVDAVITTPVIMKPLGGYQVNKGREASSPRDFDFTPFSLNLLALSNCEGVYEDTKDPKFPERSQSNQAPFQGWVLEELESSSSIHFNRRRHVSNVQIGSQGANRQPEDIQTPWFHEDIKRGRMWHSDASTADWQENPLGQEQELPLENTLAILDLSMNIKRMGHSPRSKVKVADLIPSATAEGWQVLRSRRVALEALQSEKSPIMQNHNEGGSLQNHALPTLQERLHEADATLKKAGELQTDADGTSEFGRAVTLAEIKDSREKKKVGGLQQQVKLHRSSVASSKQELINCKQKAMRILPSKEKLITGSKEGSSFEGLDSSTAGSMELEELRCEEMQKKKTQKRVGHLSAEI
ncbi:hypothetical protein U0070_003430 [Myodes glareolus]|uniref:Uncharacterized protein n=1 Tax=Myodes glareolus TaxID=447135 RepID=A0AAW0JUD4_MYOGA